MKEAGFKAQPFVACSYQLKTNRRNTKSKEWSVSQSSFPEPFDFFKAHLIKRSANNLDTFIITMDSPIIRATWQTALLNAISNILGQAVKSYQNNVSLPRSSPLLLMSNMQLIIDAVQKPFTIDTFTLITFILFSVLQCPPNFAWQTWLEKEFPSHTATTTSSNTTDPPKSSTDDKSPPEKTEKKLNLPNTAIKFILDQTLGAAVNTIIFIASMDLLRGETLEFAIQHCKRDFWGLMLAGYKMWPAVSITSFLVIPVEQRVVFGSVAGLFW